jgi:hypothetical protein
MTTIIMHGGKFLLDNNIPLIAIKYEKEGVRDVPLTVETFDLFHQRLRYTMPN